MSLKMHDPLAPEEFHLSVLREPGPPCRDRDFFQGELRGPIRVKQAVRLLIRIAELRVTKARQ